MTPRIPKQQRTDRKTNRKPKDTPHDAILRFTPYTWAKLQWFCHHGGPDQQTEIGGFAICPADDLLLVEDFITVNQQASVVSISFDDDAVADFFDRQVDLGRKPEQFARIWCHTHPGDSPEPSGTDEETFARVFGGCEWAVMFILAQGGETYARLRFNVGPGGECLIPVELACDAEFPASDFPAWEAEHRANIRSESIVARHFDLDELEIDENWLNPLGLDAIDMCDEAELQALAQDPESYEELFGDEQEDEVIE